MEGEAKQSPISEESLKRGHEGATPVSIKAFAIGLIGFIAFGAIIFGVVWGVMRGFATVQDESIGRRRSPLATTEPVPPQPWLQPSIAQGDEPRQPWQDAQAFRAHENDALNSYGKVDPQSGTVRIPIDRAMHILAERGMPTSQPTGGAK